MKPSREAHRRTALALAARETCLVRSRPARRPRPDATRQQNAFALPNVADRERYLVARGRVVYRCRDGSPHVALRPQPSIYCWRQHTHRRSTMSMWQPYRLDGAVALDASMSRWRSLHVALRPQRRYRWRKHTHRRSTMSMWQPY